MAHKLNIEVAYALPQQQWIIPLAVPEHTTVAQAIELCGLLTLCPQINLQQQKVGIFSVIVPLTHRVKAGDRIEIYRPLLIDPMARRFQRVAESRKK